MINVNAYIQISSNNHWTELETEIEVPNDFKKWSKEKQEEYINSEEAIEQIYLYINNVRLFDTGN
ncbi:MAG: hypothetical protein ACRCZK_01850 [Oscillospiraceae bacterium]